MVTAERLLGQQEGVCVCVSGLQRGECALRVGGVMRGEAVDLGLES